MTKRNRRTVAGDAHDQISVLSESIPHEQQEEAQENHIVHVLTQLGERDRHTLAAITSALARIAIGAYGVCTHCGEPIPDARLMVLPTTTTCVECAEAHTRRPLYEAPVEDLMVDS